jgi:PPOX class probable F420-dependent enzyme
MDLDQARHFLATNHRSVIQTVRADGGPHLTPVDVGIDERGRAILSGTETRVKVANLRRDPRVSLCVLSDRFYGPWVQVEGTATIVSLPEAMEGLIDYYRRVAEKEHPDWDDYREAMERDRRVLVRIDLERVVASS